MNTSTFTRPNTFLTPARAYAALADAWGINVNDLYTDAHREAVADLNAWRELTRTTTAPDVHSIIANTDRSKWLTTIKKQASDAVAAQLIDAAHPRVEATLSARVEATLTNDEAWDHVATVIDLDKATTDYINAINDLGNTVNDAVKAAQKNPAAFAAYMELSPKILYIDALGVKGRDHAALYADIPDLTELTYSKDGFGRITKHYDDETLTKHRIAQKLRDESRNDRVIIDLVLGEYNGFSFAPTLQPDVYSARVARLANVGVSRQV